MSDETLKAQTAKPTEDTIFGKIARKEIPVEFLHEDEQVDRREKHPIVIVSFLFLSVCRFS